MGRRSQRRLGVMGLYLRIRPLAKMDLFVRGAAGMSLAAPAVIWRLVSNIMGGRSLGGEKVGVVIVVVAVA